VVGAGGNLLLRYTGDSNSRSFIPFNGRLLAEYYCGGMIFDHPDEIGSATTATDCTGNLVNEKLYYPFGEFWTGYALPNLGLHQEFAKLPDYDPETDQYNTANRHYSPSGRWMSPDWSAKPQPVPYANFENPQSLNLYAYVQNNPLTGTDPNGHWCILGHGTTCTPDPPPPQPLTSQPAEQKLVAAQDAARTNPKFQPQEWTGKDGQTHRVTHCNAATCAIAKEMGAPTKPIAGVDANTGAVNLATSKDYFRVTPEVAQSLAMVGRLVIGAWENPGDHGHEVTVRPVGVPGDDPPAHGRGPLLNDIGRYDEVHYQNQSFPSSANVQYYTPAVQ